MFPRRSAHEPDRGDLAQEGELASAAFADEGLGFGEFGKRFANFSELGADEETGLPRGASKTLFEKPLTGRKHVAACV